MATLEPIPPLELCRRRHLELEDEAMAVQAARCAPAQYLDWLVQTGRFVAAIAYLAQALAPQAAVAWACACARRALAKVLPEDELAALEAAEGWLRQPDDDARREALRLAEACEAPMNAGALAAVAAFFAGGSIAPPGMPDLAPEEHLCGTMVSNAVLCAAAVGPAARLKERYAILLRLGRA